MTKTLTSRQKINLIHAKHAKTIKGKATTAKYKAKIKTIDGISIENKDKFVSLRDSKGMTSNELLGELLRLAKP